MSQKGADHVFLYKVAKMTKYRLAMTERETTINWSEADKNALITTHNASLIGKLRSMGAVELRVDDGFIPECVSFSVPIKWVKITKPKTLTDEQRAELSVRMKRIKLNMGSSQTPA